MLDVIDPGHGGSDPGAVYNGRQEKDDVLRLGKAVGALLEARGVDVVYTRDGDFYETPFKKAQDGNNVGADYFVSIHRNSSEYPDQYSGAEVLVYSDSGIKKELANNILEGMEKAGLKNLGIDERKDLVVLRRTRMPAVLVEAGFINSDKDNETFDRNFDELAQGIANGILQTLGYPVYTSPAATTADMWQDDGNMGNTGNMGNMGNMGKIGNEGNTGGTGNVGNAGNMRDSTGLPYPDGMDNNAWRNETNNDSGMRKDRADDNMQNNRGNDGMRMDRGNDMRWDDGMYDGGSMMGDNQQGRMPSDSTQDYGVRGGERFYDESAEIFNEPGTRSCNCQCKDVLYRVQVGAYRNKDNADRMLNSLLVDGFPAFIVYDDGLYKVQVGAYRNLSNAIAMEYKLRQYRYNTYITTK